MPTLTMRDIIRARAIKEIGKVRKADAARPKCANNKGYHNGVIAPQMQARLLDISVNIWQANKDTVTLNEVRTIVAVEFWKAWKELVGSG